MGMLPQDARRVTARVGSGLAPPGVRTVGHGPRRTPTCAPGAPPQRLLVPRQGVHDPVVVCRHDLQVLRRHGCQTRNLTTDSPGERDRSSCSRADMAVRLTSLAFNPDLRPMRATPWR